LSPSLSPSTSQSRTTSSVGAYPISAQAFPVSLGAFPISAGAFPISVGAFPISAAAFPVCSNQDSGNPKNISAGCGALKRISLGIGIPAGTPAILLPGYQPLHLRGAYGVIGDSASSGSGQVVAIVSAYIDKTIESDLAVYRSTFGLSPCTVANGCLTIDQPNGNKPIPDPTWGEETAIDTEMVSAICPNCKIVVVEAKSSQIQDLAQSVDTAASYHPAAISNSYAIAEDGDSDDKKLASYAGHYRRDNIAVVAGAGDAGYGVNFPASVDRVIAVGGTTLAQNTDGTFAPQVVWSGSGAGCSSIIKKPKWQNDTGCKNRTANDIAAVADPRSGVAGYSSYGNGWSMYGGTSVATPIIAAMYALAGSTQGMHDGSGLYSAPSGSFAWVYGTDGVCSPAYLCTASGLGYNGPAGNGVPYGLSAFRTTH
jgi:subtilase family serine protease